MLDYKFSVDIFFQFLPVWAQQMLSNIALETSEKFIGNKEILNIYTYPSFISITFKKFPWGSMENSSKIHWKRNIINGKSLPNFDNDKKLNEFINSFKKKNLEITIDNNQYTVYKVYKEIKQFTEDLVIAILKAPVNYQNSLVDYKAGGYIVPRPIEGYGYRFAGQPSTNIIHGAPFNFQEYYQCSLTNLCTLEQRKKNLSDQLQQICQNHGLNFHWEEKNILEAIFMHYNPFGIIGTFEEQYLSLPREIIQSSLMEHNNGLLGIDNNNQMCNKFLCFIDYNSNQNLDLVIKGYEDTVNLRLKEALYYLKEDLLIGLEKWEGSLKKVMFFKDKLSMADKQKQVLQILISLNDSLSLFPTRDVEQLKNYLIDLNAKTVQEFNNLQGYMSYIIQKDYLGENASQALLDYYKKNERNKLACFLRMVNNIYDVLMTIALGGNVSAVADRYNLKTPLDEALNYLILLEIDIDFQQIIKHLSSNLDFTRAIEFIYQRWVNKISNKYSSSGSELGNSYNIGYSWWREMGFKEKILKYPEWNKIRPRLKGFAKKAIDKEVNNSDISPQILEQKEKELYGILNNLEESKNYEQLYKILPATIEKIDNYLNTHRIEDSIYRKYLMGRILQINIVAHL